jgi:hypothetical protein
VQNRADSSSKEKKLNVKAVLNIALQHHTAGDLLKAESLYNEILRRKPQ